MKKFIIYHKDFILKVHFSENNTCIFDSYRVKKLEDMKSILYYLKREVSSKYAINKRGVNSMIHEWRVHNLLYSLGIKKDRTKDVDLNINQPWYIKSLYLLLSPLYPYYR